MAVEVVRGAKSRRARYKKRDGTVVPGVTTVLGELNKPALMYWANKIGLEGYEVRKYVDELAEIGKLAHQMIEDHLAGHKVRAEFYPDASQERFDRATNSFLKYLEWENQHEIEVVGTEVMVVSEKWGFGGTIDAILKVDGVITIGDWKTGKAIYDEHLFQVAAYATAAWENGIQVEQIGILQIGRNEEEGFSEKTIPAHDIGPYWDVFRSALGVYGAKKELKKWRK